MWDPLSIDSTPTNPLQDAQKITAITPIVISNAVFVLSPKLLSLSHTHTIAACASDYSKKMDGEWRFRFLYFVKQRESFLGNGKEYSYVPNDV
jgi:hypothetical protein